MHPTATPRVALFTDSYFEANGVARTATALESFAWQRDRPLLIVHGDRDDVIPFRFGRELFDLANQPKTFVRIAGGGHNDLPQYGLYKLVWRFLGVGRGAAAPQTRPGAQLPRNA